MKALLDRVSLVKVSGQKCNLHDSKDDVGFVFDVIECNWSNHNNHEIPDPVKNC